jgi:hypothetical protein
MFEWEKTVHVLDPAATVMYWIIRNGVNYRITSSGAYHVRVIKPQDIYDLPVSNKNAAEFPWTEGHIDRRKWRQSDVGKEGTGTEHAP